MTLYNYIMSSKCTPYFWILLSMHVLIILVSIWLTYKSITNTDWELPYTKSRLVNYSLAVVGSSSIVTILMYPEYKQFLLCGVHLILLVVVSIIYHQLKYDSSEVLHKLRKLVRARS